MKKGKDLSKRLQQLRMINLSIESQIDGYERHFKKKEYEFFFNIRKNIIK